MKLESITAARVPTFAEFIRERQAELPPVFVDRARMRAIDRAYDAKCERRDQAKLEGRAFEGSDYD